MIKHEIRGQLEEAPVTAEWWLKKTASGVIRLMVTVGGKENCVINIEPDGRAYTWSLTESVSAALKAAGMNIKDGKLAVE